MALPPQPNFLTLACRDIERMAEMLRAFGWPESPESEPAHRLFQGSNGVVIALYGAKNYEPHFGAVTDGFRGFTLGINLAAAEEVDRVHAALQQIRNVELLEEPFDSAHGFRGFSFRDPEGNIWDVGWKRGSRVSPDGRLTWSG